MTEANGDTNESDAGKAEVKLDAESTSKDISASTEHQPTKPLPSPRVKLESQLAILRAFAAASGREKKAVQNGEVGAVAGVNASTVSSCNKFFADIGLLDPQGRGYVPAEEVFEFHRKNDWDADTSPHALAPKIRKAWFWDTLASRLSFRPLTEDEAISALADEVKAGPIWRANLGMIVDLLVVTGVVTREANGTIKRAPTDHHVSREEPRRENTPIVAAHIPGPPSAPAAAQTHQNVMSLSMSITVPMDQLSRWNKPERVVEFFAEWAKLVTAKATIERMISQDDGGGAK